MDAPGISWRLRNGDPPTHDELNWFAAGLADQSVSDAQAGAFAMAVCLNGLGDAGRRPDACHAGQWRDTVLGF